jgi:hypothetical protein
MGGFGGGGGGTTVIQTPPAPPNPDADPATIEAIAQNAASLYQTEVVSPTLLGIQDQQQSMVPLNLATTGFYPEQQQEYAQTATGQIQNLYSQTSVSAELAAQQSMFQAGMANMQSLTQAAQQRSQLQEASYQAYAQEAPTFAMGFANLFSNPSQQQQNQQATTQQGSSYNPASMPGVQGMI